MLAILRTYVDVKPVVMIGASVDLHTCYGGRLLFEGGLLLYIRLYFGEAIIPGGATKQRGRLFKEIRYASELERRQCKPGSELIQNDSMKTAPSTVL